MMSAPTAAQYAAIEALQSGEEDVQGMLGEYAHRRALVIKACWDMGLELVEPRGAFYAFPSIRSTGLDDEEFAERLLLEEKVAVVPGQRLRGRRRRPRAHQLRRPALRPAARGHEAHGALRRPLPHLRKVSLPPLHTSVIQSIKMYIPWRYMRD